MKKKSYQRNEYNVEEEILHLRSVVNELKILNELAIAAGRATNLDQLVKVIIHKIIEFINAEQGSIQLVTKKPEKEFTTFIRQDNVSQLKHNYHVGDHITGWVLLNKKPLIIEDLSKDNRFKTTKEERKDIRSVICVPIWYKGNIIGIMMLVNKKNQKSFNDEDLSLLSIISVQVGQLIKNTELQNEAFEKRKEAELAILETEKLHELDKIKTDFFTNISHEFRTPLSLIIGPVKQLLNDETIEMNSSKHSLILRNAQNLLNLINEILELSKIESGTVKLKVQKTEIKKLIQSLVKSFYPLSEKTGVKIKFVSGLKSNYGYIDREKVTKIFNNLISNSFKFTSNGGEIIVQLNNSDLYKESVSSKLKHSEKIIISVKDNGKGISEDHLSKIFDRFYRGENEINSISGSSGIGLSLTKELINLHRGRIDVKSKIDEGTEFKFLIPISKEFYNVNEISEEDNVFDENKNSFDILDETIIQEDQKYNTDEDAAIKEKSEKPLILVVEDNNELRKYVIENIEHEYKILESVNGEKALECALINIPDLIISDIMMPKMDGIELCEKIKTDERTSHIPVILLTAKADLENKIEGLETGVDDYITKPFEIAELKTRIKNLIAQRKKLRKRFGKSITLEPKEIAITSADEKFLIRVLNIIEEKIDDPDLNVQNLSDILGMSRIQLFRKIKALTDQSVSEFIRSIRLKRSLSLLKFKSGNISEIAYDVGFSNPAYFSECFKKQFGKLPSEYIINPQ